MQSCRWICKLLLLSLLAHADFTTSAPLVYRPLKSMDLSEPFHTRTRWRFIATQGPEVDREHSSIDSVEPGEIRLCITNTDGHSCAPDVQARFHAARGDDVFAVEDHYLRGPLLVYPHGRAAPPLLLIRTASLHGGNGSQRATLQALAYERHGDRFHLAYDHETGGNMNQEMRYVTAGPLKSMIISAQPTDDAPYGYWIEVNRLTPGYSYNRVLRYRSATHYGDGNMLAVIDSEMAGILQRLGRWRPGMPLPGPAPCPRPRLVDGAIWCR